MASTLTKILLHITFSTKDRANLIPAEFESELYAYIGGVCRNNGSVLLAAGGVGDHIHLFVNLGKTMALSDLMLNIKRDSSRWLKERFPVMQGFAWQEGYFAFSIGESMVARLRAYIADQKNHHQRVSFQEEVIEFPNSYGVEYDEAHVWT